jgi:DNA-binding transcriptional LysR family regulator
MIGNAFNLKQLEALVWVADLGSFRKAAQHLNTSQPNISARIAALESSLNITLMQRDGGTIRLTDKGHEILHAARQVLRDAEALVEVADRRELIDDRLRLGVTELVACTWLHSYLRAIKQTYPGILVELTVDLSRNLDKELNSGALDLTIQTAPFGVAASGVVELGVFDYVWVGTAEKLSDLPDKPGLQHLLPLTILTHARHTQAYNQLIEWAETNSLPTARIAPSSSMASCVQMAADGLGVALLPRALVERELAAGVLALAQVDWHPSPLRFAARYQAERVARYVAELADLARDVVGDYRANC